MGTDIVHFLRSNYQNKDGKLTQSAISNGVAAFQAQTGSNAGEGQAISAAMLSLGDNEVITTDPNALATYSGISRVNTSIGNRVTLGVNTTTTNDNSSTSQSSNVYHPAGLGLITYA